MKIFIIIISISFLLSFEGSVISQEPVRVQATKKWLEDRGLMPIIKALGPLFTHSIEGRLDEVNEIMTLGKGVRQQMENDPGLKSLGRAMSGSRDIEVAAVKYISASMFEFFLIIPSSDGPVGFRLGVSTYKEKMSLSYFSGTEAWERIVEMSDGFDIFPATATIHTD